MTQLSSGDENRRRALQASEAYRHAVNIGNPHETSKESIDGLKSTDTPTFDGLTVNKFYDIKGTNSGYRDMHGQITIKGSGSQDPSWSIFRNGIKGYSFSATQMNEVLIEFHPDHDYDAANGFYPHFHISTSSNNPAGVVRLGFEYTSAKGYDQGASSYFPVTQTIYIEQAMAANDPYKHIIVEYPTPILDLNVETDSLILSRVFRDAANGADTFTGTIFLFRFDLHYRTNRISTPNKNYPFE